MAEYIQYIHIALFSLSPFQISICFLNLGPSINKKNKCNYKIVPHENKYKQMSIYQKSIPCIFNQKHMWVCEVATDYVEFSAAKKKKKKISIIPFQKQISSKVYIPKLETESTIILSRSRDKRFDSVDNHITFQYKVKNAGANAVKRIFDFIWLYI